MRLNLHRTVECPRGTFRGVELLIQIYMVRGSTAAKIKPSTVLGEYLVETVGRDGAPCSRALT